MNKNERAGFWAALEGKRPQTQAHTQMQTPAQAQEMQSTRTAGFFSHGLNRSAAEARPESLESRQEPSLDSEFALTEQESRAGGGLGDPSSDAPTVRALAPEVEIVGKEKSRPAAQAAASASAFGAAAQGWNSYSVPNMPQAQIDKAEGASFSVVNAPDVGPAEQAHYPRPGTAKLDKVKAAAEACKEWASRIPKPQVPTGPELKAAMHRKSRRLNQRLRTFPWRNTGQVLLARFKEDRLGVTASSLTFTSLLALVPFFTVALALFTAFPIFGKVQQVLERWLMDSLIPETIARQVLGYLTQFASKASQLGLVGFSILIITAVMLILTIDRTLNNIWRVRQLRPLGQRVLIYWAAITLGPLLLGLSLVLSSYVMSASKGLVNTLPGSLRFVFDSIEFMVLAAGMAGLYHYVPNTPVRWRHALAGGVFVAVFMEVAKKVLGMYLSSVPTYSVIYGAFATLPILLIWMYVAWSIVLMGALVTAYLPTVLAGVERMTGHRGWQFELAVEVLQCLTKERNLPHKGLYVYQLSRRLRVEAAQIQPVLQTLAQMDWVGAVQPPDAYASLESTEPRYVLLVDPQITLVKPLVESLLIQTCGAVEPLWQRAQLDTMNMAELIAVPVADIHRDR